MKIATFLANFLFAAALTMPSIPPNATLLQEGIGTCDGVTPVFHRDFDTDGDPSNGAEVHAYGILRTGEIRLFIRYAAGEGGNFDEAFVKTQSGVIRFNTKDELVAAYPSPCAVLQSEEGYSGPRT